MFSSLLSLLNKSKLYSNLFQEDQELDCTHGERDSEQHTWGGLAPSDTVEFDHSADDPMGSRSNRVHERARVAEPSAGSPARGQSSVEIKRVRFNQDVTGEQTD